jgi:hypothetical protein
MLLLGAIHRRIELDEKVPSPDLLAIKDMDRADHPDVERLDDLAATARHDLPLRCGFPQLAQPRARQNAPMITKTIARPIGDGGDSTISSAAGRNVSSRLLRRGAGRGKGTTRAEDFILFACVRDG